MKLIDEMQLLLDKTNVGEFFRTLKKKFLERYIFILEPHKKEEKSMGTTFYCTVGMCGEDMDVKKSDVDLASDKRFIILATAEISVYEDMGVESPVFNVYPSSFFSYSTYPLLKRNDLEFVKSQMQCDVDALIEIVDHLNVIKKKVARSVRILQKKFNKLYISKCKSAIKDGPKTILEVESYTSGYTDALNNLLDWMQDIDKKI